MTDLPYMASTKNLSSILKQIRTAQTPPRFTHEFLKSNLAIESWHGGKVVLVWIMAFVIGLILWLAVVGTEWDSILGMSEGTWIAMIVALFVVLIVMFFSVVALTWRWFSGREKRR